VNDLGDAIKAFIKERDWEQFHSPKNLAMALSVEVAEVVEHFQWLTQEQSHNLPADKLAEVREEIGDVMIYLTELADKLGIDPIEAAKAKLRINEPQAKTLSPNPRRDESCPGRVLLRRVPLYDGG
jgi:dCTP diphosphatase